ncbi:hypothetical protein ATZ33_03290 [Enterococcus silesiacus]|uniref:L-lactate permease n=1 Tax=Enterococcus silesiacus TaxID=332949 RepID=A0ABM5W648_9ENTE|nr:hypothetical protein ATZ33_03290 [Enterococcus silesiacus]
MSVLLFPIFPLVTLFLALFFGIKKFHSRVFCLLTAGIFVCIQLAVGFRFSDTSIVQTTIYILVILLLLIIPINYFWKFDERNVKVKSIEIISYVILNLVWVLIVFKTFVLGFSLFLSIEMGMF